MKNDDLQKAVREVKLLMDAGLAASDIVNAAREVSRENRQKNAKSVVISRNEELLVVANPIGPPGKIPEICVNREGGRLRVWLRYRSPLRGEL
jgi:hypothetical protein